MQQNIFLLETSKRLDEQLITSSHEETKISEEISEIETNFEDIQQSFKIFAYRDSIKNNDILEELKITANDYNNNIKPKEFSKLMEKIEKFTNEKNETNNNENKLLCEKLSNNKIENLNNLEKSIKEINLEIPNIQRDEFYQIERLKNLLDLFDISYIQSRVNKNDENILVMISCDATEYQFWQVRVAALSLRKANQKNILRVLNAPSDYHHYPELEKLHGIRSLYIHSIFEDYPIEKEIIDKHKFDEIPTFYCPSYVESDPPGDHYPPRNRIGGLIFIFIFIFIFIYLYLFVFLLNNFIR